jgi:hypothetical protein
MANVWLIMVNGYWIQKSPASGAGDKDIGGITECRLRGASPASAMQCAGFPR